MLDPIVMGVIIYASMLIILCIGFSLTYMLERFPNFAHTSLASVGTMLTYTMVRLKGLNPYLSWPLISLLGGLLGIAIYMLIIRPLQRAGSSGIMLSFAMFALSFIMNSTLYIYSYWILMNYGFRAGGFILRAYDYRLWGYPAVFFTAPLISIILVYSLHHFLTRVKFGIALRATVENPELAQSLGVNVFHVHLASWFLTGFTSALAGAVLSLWSPTRLDRSDQLLMSVMAGSVLGGLENLYGAIVGGLILALAQIILPGLLIRIFGVWIGGYEPLVPMLVIIFTLLIEPNGLTGFLSGREGTLSGVLGLLKRQLNRAQINHKR
ncbi:MAG: branched-chain amino acid ABC transporter permease [Candidatus Bathyarchaeia archaeon]|nr:branched-chain amino acid ABC transporter permease [Candidatus Bathyarchaeota archaeon]